MKVNVFLKVGCRSAEPKCLTLESFSKNCLVESSSVFSNDVGEARCKEGNRVFLPFIASVVKMLSLLGLFILVSTLQSCNLHPCPIGFIERTKDSVALPIVDITMDVGDLSYMDKTHLKSVQPNCQFSLLGIGEESSQPLKIQLAGSGSRYGALKSYELKSSKKLGFKSIPNHFLNTNIGKYKSLKLRNITSLYHGQQPLFNGLSNNAFMTIMGRNSISGIDYQETLQVAVFFNECYHGIYDLTETTNTNYLKAKYGLGKDDINYCKLSSRGDTIVWQFKDKQDSLAFYSMWKDVLAASSYDEVAAWVDMDNLIDYYLTEIYIKNSDWPTNNCIVWRKRDGGKWKYILNDFDYAGLSVDGDNVSILGSDDRSDIFVKSVYQKLCHFDQFKSHLSDRMFIACATYLRPDRVSGVVDSLAANIRSEIPYQAQLYKEVCKRYKLETAEYDYYDSWEASVKALSNWGAERKSHIYGQMHDFTDISNQILPLSIHSDGQFLFNGERVREDYEGDYFQEKPIHITDASGKGCNLEVKFFKKDGSVVKKTIDKTFSIPQWAEKTEVMVVKNAKS